MAQLKSTNILGNLAVTGDIVASSIKISSGSDESVLLAGGGTKPLSELGSNIELDADLTAIAALSGNSGFLKKTAANTWTLDTTAYTTNTGTVTQITLGAGLAGGPITTTGTITLDKDLEAIAALGGTSGFLKKTAANTWTLDTTAYTTNTGTVTKIELGMGLSGGPITTTGTISLDADLAAIAGLTGTSGFLKKTAANTWELDTSCVTSAPWNNLLMPIVGRHSGRTDYFTLATSTPYINASEQIAASGFTLIDGDKLERAIFSYDGALEAVKISFN